MSCMARQKKSQRLRKRSSSVLAVPPGPQALPLKPRIEQAAFAIVGIGSSAGGSEALEEFFRHLPSDPGAAFVVVSHQHPTHSSLLAEILRRWTPLPVIEAADGLPVQPNHIYVPLTRSRLAILHGVLHLVNHGN